MSAHAAENTRALQQEDGFIACPECGQDLCDLNLSEHLIRSHGYVDLDGILMPLEAARTCLWDRVFTTGDQQAHDRLCQILAAGPALQTDRPPYFFSLEMELLRRADELLSNKRAGFQRLVRCLRQSEAARPYFWQLLMSPDARLRQLARELILPELSETSELKTASSAEVRGWLDRLCPVEEVRDKLAVCHRLPQFGVSRAAVAECLRELHGEQSVGCTECTAAIPRDQMEGHLRRAHRIFEFRGIRQSLPESIASLLAAVCGASPDHDAWEAIESLARDEYGTQADTFLAAKLPQALEKVEPRQRSDALRSAAEVIAASGSGSGLTMLLAKSAEPTARQLALTLATLLPAPLSASVVSGLQPLLIAKSAPAEIQIAAAAALLRTTGKEGAAARDIVNALVVRGGKARAVDRLNQLEEQVGPSRLIAQRRTEIENQIRMRCPRCAVQLRRPQMAEHLWSEHSLLLDGRRVRQPWRLVEDWITAYRGQEAAQGTGPRSELLARCRALGQHLDPEHGLHRVYRLFLTSGIADAEARRSLLAEARKRRSSLCPRCFALVPLPDETMPRPLNQSHGRLSLGDYRVEVSESGLAPRLIIEAPGRILFRGREPHGWLTRKGATLFVAGPPVVAALLYAIVHSSRQPVPWLPVLAFLSVGLAIYFVVQLYWWLRPGPLDRSVDFAWTQLVPDVGGEQVTSDEASFLAGLALTTIGQGRPESRQEQLDRILEMVKRSVAAGTVPLAHLAALQRLAVADAAAAGHDPVSLVIDQLGRCFQGRLPLTFAQSLLTEWEGPWWTAGNLARLRILLCDRAFEAGWEVGDLLEVGLMAPALGDVFQTDNPQGLAHLRLLWSLRPSLPWAAWSEAATVFELALDPDKGSAWLHQYPDLLLLDEDSPAIIVCGRGIIFQETVFSESPVNIGTRARRAFDGTEYELGVGMHYFRLITDPTPVVGRLRHWFDYLFGEFLPKADGVRAWQAPEGSKSAQIQEQVACPECRRLLLPRAGQVGRIKVGEAVRE
jgi:hypothetical protein